MTSALSYFPTSKKLRSGLGFKDRMAIIFNVAVLFVCYPLYHMERLRWLPPILYRVMRDYRVEMDGLVFTMPGNFPVESTLLNADYEPEVRKIVKGFKSGVFINAGAALGLYTLMSSKVMGHKGEVVAIEPDPLMFSHLQENLRQNKCWNVTSYYAAAWSSKTTLKLYDNPLTRFASSVMDGSKPEQYGGYFDMTKTVTLDSVTPEGSPILIVADVEGAEPEVFKGGAETLARRDVTVIFEALTADALTKCKAVLEPMGYAIQPLIEADTRNYLARKP